MDKIGSDTLFTGSVAELYDTQMVPLIFQPYADDMAPRVAALKPARVLETAAGTGVLTRALALALLVLVALLGVLVDVRALLGEAEVHERAMPAVPERHSRCKG